METLADRAGMARLDEAAIEEIGLPLLAMMEHAGRHLAAVAREVGEAPFVLLAGKGNNGGGGLCAARHLANAGEDVAVLLAYPADDLTGAARTQLGILETAGVAVEVVDPGADAVEALARAARAAGADPPATLVDALLGYNAEGAPRPPLDGVVEAVQGTAGAAVVSLDLPTGLDATTGEAAEPVLDADVTATLAAVKRGLTVGRGPELAGRVCLCDLGIPEAAYDRAGLKRPGFGDGPEGRRWI